MKKMHGFTLIELMITVALIAIISSMALPAFRDMVSSQRIMTSANEIVTTFHQARSEAIKRSRQVNIVACKPDCGSTGAADWNNGWQIITDIGGTDTVIGEHAALAGSINITANGTTLFATSYTYSAQGRLAPNITATHELKLCDSNTELAGRRIILEPIGHISTESTTCTAP